MQESLRNMDKLPSHYPPEMQDFVNSHQLPSWADLELLKEGARFYDRYAFPIDAMLNWYSLPVTYTIPEGAIVLEKTGEIISHTMPRIVNTGRLLVAVGEPNNFSPHGKAIKVLSKVRLTHAFVRYSLLNDQNDPWDTVKNNIPINQRDTLGTLLVFSGLIIDGLEKLGVVIKPRDIEAYIHLWNVSGILLGIFPELLPQTTEDTFAIMRYICGIAQRSDTGVALQKALTEYLKKYTPGTLGKGIHETMMRYLLGNNLADILDIRKDQDWTRHLIRIIRIRMKHYEKRGDKSEFYAWRHGVYEKTIIKLLEQYFHQGRRDEFELAKNMERLLKID